MTWTTEAPGVEGWYWVRLYPNCVPTACMIEGERIFTIFDGPHGRHRNTFKHDCPEAEFQGPIHPDPHSVEDEAGEAELIKFPWDSGDGVMGSALKEDAIYTMRWLNTVADVTIVVDEIGTKWINFHIGGSIELERAYKNSTFAPIPETPNAK